MKPSSLSSCQIFATSFSEVGRGALGEACRSACSAGLVGKSTARPAVEESWKECASAPPSSGRKSFNMVVPWRFRFSSGDAHHQRDCAGRSPNAQRLNEPVCGCVHKRHQQSTAKCEPAHIRERAASRCTAKESSRSAEPEAPGCATMRRSAAGRAVRGASQVDARELRRACSSTPS